MNPIAIRLLSQQLICPQFDTPQKVVSHFGAMQAQDYRMVRWAVMMRTRKPSSFAFKNAYDEGKIVRLHLLRGTWQLVSNEDYWWMLDLISPKATSVVKGWMKSNKISIDDSELNLIHEIFVQKTDEMQSVTSKDLNEALLEKGIIMLNCSYNLGMRHLKGYIPEYPVGTAEEVAKMIADFVPVARVILGLKGLKIITFGPRPQDFFACNAPIKGLYELGVEIEENSELDLLVAYKEHANDPRIDEVCADMAKEMGEGCYYPDLSRRMAQFELTLLDWAEAHKGSRQYVAFADKCWPAFPSQFGFEPCYVNSRLVSRGIPVACEVDVYGALSEYIGMCASDDTVTLLDINNSVPQYIYDEDIKGKYDYKLTDTFMGFHCGNTPQCKMCSSRKIKYQLIQNRLLENGCKPDFTRGTLEGDIAASDITFYRLQCDSQGNLRSYIAEGEVLDVPTRSFGGIGIFAINEMGRFYRHVLIQKGYPHHGAVAFSHVGKTLFEVFKYLGIKDIAYNQPASLPYPTENPWK